MNRYSLKSILVALNSGRKGKFTVHCSHESRDYIFYIDKNVTLVQQDSKDFIDMSRLFPNAEEVKIPDHNYKLESIKETILTPSNKIYTETCYYCHDLVQVYLPVFRVYGEQVVFILKYSTGFKKMYFINGRVFYTEVNSDSITLYQSDLRQIFNSFPNSEISFFERLPKRYSYNTISRACSEKADALGLRFISSKKGVLVRGDVRC